jgi:hypothetical protein
MNLRLLGAPTIKDVVPNMVDASALHMHATSVPQGSMYDANCQSAQATDSLLMAVQMKSSHQTVRSKLVCKPK